MLTFRSITATHPGMVRQLNEDSLVSRDDAGLWAVADGMGGHQAGDLASQTVKRALEQVPVTATLSSLLQATRTAISDANAELLGLDSQYDPGRVPGSTVAALLIREGEGAVVWAGDSRIYRLRDGETQQITRDHSHVQELVDQRLIEPEEAEQHPMANVITRAVGIEEPIELDVLHFRVAPDDRFLLCSDGLSRLLTLEEIHDQVRSSDPDEAVRSLLHTALVRGAPDNVSIISVKRAEPENDTEDATRVAAIG